MRFSNKIPKYSRISVPASAGQKSPAEQRFVGGVFALSACYIGNSAGLLHCLRVSALFVLRLFWLVFYNRFGRSIGVRCFFRLRIQSPALSPTLPRARCPASASGRHLLVHPVRISRCKPLLLHSGALSAYTSWTGLSLPVIHSPALRRYISALEASVLNCVVWALKASAASTLDCCAWALETSALEALAESTRPSASPALDVLIRALAVFTRPSASPTLDVLIRTLVVSTRPSASPALDVLIRTLAIWTIGASWSPDALVVSTRPSASPALVLIRTLGKRAIWAWYPGVVRLCRIEVCTHLWSAGHSASPSLSAAATATASARTGERLTGQNRHSQHNNDRCYDFCLFHFRFLSLTFYFSAFLSPLLGSFYLDSGAGGKKVTQHFRNSIAYCRFLNRKPKIKNRKSSVNLV